VKMVTLAQAVMGEDGATVSPGSGPSGTRIKNPFTAFEVAVIGRATGTEGRGHHAGSLPSGPAMILIRGQRSRSRTESAGPVVGKGYFVKGYCSSEQQLPMCDAHAVWRALVGDSPAQCWGSSRPRACGRRRR